MPSSAIKKKTTDDSDPPADESKESEFDQHHRQYHSARKADGLEHGDLGYFFFNDKATTEIYTLSLHDALPIPRRCRRPASARRPRAGEGGRRAPSPAP